MKIAVTGANGFLGTSFADRVSDKPIDFSVLMGPGDEKSYRCWENASTDVVIGSVFDKKNEAKRVLNGADVLLYMAAWGVNSSRKDMDMGVQVNVQAPFYWFTKAKEFGVKQCLYVGTSLEYQGHGCLPDQHWNVVEKGEPTCAENASIGASDFYGATKAAGGQLLTALSTQFELPLWYFRIASMYGKGDARNKIIPATIEACLKGSVFETSLGEQVRDWINIEDCIDCILHAIMKTPKDLNCVVNVGTGHGVSLKETIKQIYEWLGGDLDKVAFGTRPYRKKEPHYLVLDTKKCTEVLAWRAQKMKLDQATVFAIAKEISEEVKA